MWQVSYESPVGTLWLAGQGNELNLLSFEKNADLCENEQMTDSVRRWLDSYFRREPADVEFVLAPQGTRFQRLIWKLLMEIPFGQTRTYGDLAREAANILGKEKMSPQAVGQAVGRNPIAIIIPCHRVIGAGGRLTGYAYGLERKAWLLGHEQKLEGLSCGMQHLNRLKQNG